MKKKMRSAAVLAVLLILIALCFRAAEGLREKIEAGRPAAGNASVESSDRIVLDAGHGGIDAGKVGVNGAEEKTINLSIALKIQKILEKEGIEVVMTRASGDRLADSQVEDLKKRVEIMNEENPVLAVSIHQNSYHEESVRGGQVFYYKDSAEGKKAAEMIQECLRALDPEHAKDAKANDTYYILKKTEVPVAIAECGFLSNSAEAELLASEEYQEKVAQAVAEGIIQYMETVR